MKRNEIVNGEIRTLCEHKFLLWSIHKVFSFEELQEEGQHLQLQEELLGVYLNLIIEIAIGSPLLFGVIYIT